MRQRESGTMSSLFKLRSRVQNYAWGLPGGVSRLFGGPPSTEPEAELWMGAHPRLPSPLDAPFQGATDLLELLEQCPNLLTGAEKSAVLPTGRSAPELPWLFKVLSAGAPLSLQAHPNSQQARKGFEREEGEGVAPDAFERNYKDARHKPELICALTPFTALCGFSTHSVLKGRLEKYKLVGSGGPLETAGNSLDPSKEQETLRELFRAIYALDASQLKDVIEAIVSVSKADEDPLRDELLLELAELYPGDPGIVASLLLNVVRLKPGEALFLPAGQLHAYVRGTGLEIMACSDNVLRGGLTPKHVDVPELLRVLNFAPLETRVLHPVPTDAHRPVQVERYPTPADEFELQMIELSQGQSLEDFGPHIVLVLDGQCTLRSGDQRLSLKKGDQAFCGAEFSYQMDGVGRFARAVTPAKSL